MLEVVIYIIFFYFNLFIDDDSFFLFVASVLLRVLTVLARATARAVIDQREARTSASDSARLDLMVSFCFLIINLINRYLTP